MKKIITITLLSVLTLASSGCLRSGMAALERKSTQLAQTISTSTKDRVTRLTARHRSFDSLVRAGGLSVGDPILLEDGWFLPIHVSVQGNRRAIVEDGEQQYPEVVYGIEHDITKHNFIRFYVKTGMPTSKHEPQHTNGIFLGNIKPGEYLLQYKNPDFSRIDLALLEFSNTATTTTAQTDTAHTSQ